MTALDLGTATRTLTVPGSAFSTVPYGDVNLIPVTAPVTPTTWNGIPALPVTASWATDRTLYSDADFSVPQNTAIFIAVGGFPTASSNWNALYHYSGFNLIVNDTELRDWAGGNAATSGNAPVTLATAIQPTDLVVWCITSNSTEMRALNSIDGTIDVLAGAQSATPINTFEVYLNGEDAYILGVWQFDNVTVNETDAIDTMAAIEAELTPASSVGATGAGGWGILGAATGSDDDDEDDPAVTVPNAGGAQDAPANPTPASPSAMQAAGVYPIRHVWETMPAPTLDADMRPLSWSPSASGNDEYAYLQIVVEGVDITLYNGIETPFPQWRRAEPFGAQAATIELPQITAFHSTPAWAIAGANVSIRLDIIGGSPVSLFEGFVMDTGVREDSGTFTLEAMGVLYGADLTLRKPAFTTAPKDIGSLIPHLLNHAPSRRWSSTAKAVTGIQSSVAGGWEPLLTGYIQELLATALDSSKRQWTLSCVNRQPVLELKDTTTIAATVRAGQRGVSIDLNSDASEAPNAIYGEGIASDGGRWRNAKYPNWKPDDTPDYPYNPPTTSIKVGTRDADTDSGDGVSVWQRKVGQPVTGTFSRADRIALKRIQRAGGILDDGFLGPQSWATTFDTGANTGSLDGAFIAPLAAATEVESRLYGPDGDDLGANPDYDADIIRVERKINYGQGVPKSKGVTNAKRTLARDSNPGWLGVITFTLDPSTKSKYELREGENIRVLGWRGQDITVHIASARYDESAVTLEVDSKARDYPTLQALMTRDRDAVDPAKVAARRLLAGEIQTDRATYDAESPAGRMPRHAVYGGLWDVRRMPMGAFGRIVRTDFRTSSSATPFALAVFGKPLTAADLVSLIGNPLTATTNPWSEYGDELEDLGLLQAWGWKEQPAGYYPRTYSDPTGTTAAPVTGRLLDDASWDYASAQSPWLWVATIAASSCNVEGRFYGGAD